ncbi:MAG TPA: GNAT family N-acetyltransferase [Gemmatimonadales bacterium]|nr:GNAT family N-acetyltransferase [Gemmatimonadales bacterium]
MTTWTITPAHPDDIPALAELLGVLFEQEAELQPDQERQRAGLALILQNPQAGQIFCARSVEGILGMVSLLFSISTVEGGSAAWLEDMIVRPEARELGIGAALVHHAISHARAIGCRRIMLLTDAGNVRAQQLYRRMGFVQSAMVPMRLQL